MIKGKIGKTINFKKFNVNCKGCRGKFNNFIRYSLSPDCIKWNCIDCGSEFNLYCEDYETNEEITLKIKVFHTIGGMIKNCNYILINNTNFKEVFKE